MQYVKTPYSSYQELLLDLDIFGTLISAKQLPYDELRELLFESFRQSHPIPKLEDVRYTLSELVSADFHVKYGKELELKENEELLELTKGSCEEDYKLDSDDFELPDDFPFQDFNFIMSEVERKELIKNSEYFNQNKDIETFTGDVSEIESKFNTTKQVDMVIQEEDLIQSNIMTEEKTPIIKKKVAKSSPRVILVDGEPVIFQNPVLQHFLGSTNITDDSYEDDEDDDEIFSEVVDNEDTKTLTTSDDSYEEYDEDYDDDIDFSTELVKESNQKENLNYTEQDNIQTDDFEMEFEEPTISVNPPVALVKPQKPVVIPVKETVVVETSQRPTDLIQFLKQNPQSEVSVVLKYFSRKEVERQITMGRIIKRGSKLHI